MINSSLFPPDKSLQDTYAPQGRCFGCGPKNEQGLQIKTIMEGSKGTCIWMPKAHHLAFENMLSGGICGTLLDCHSNWTGAYHLMLFNKLDAPPCTVTAKYSVELLRPVPMGQPLFIEAWIENVSERKANVKAQIRIDDLIFANCTGLFVAVKPDHPAYHRW